MHTFTKLMTCMYMYIHPGLPVWIPVPYTLFPDTDVSMVWSKGVVAGAWSPTQLHTRAKEQCGAVHYGACWLRSHHRPQCRCWYWLRKSIGLRLLPIQRCMRSAVCMLVSIWPIISLVPSFFGGYAKESGKPVCEVTWQGIMVMSVGSNNRRTCCMPRSLAKPTDSVARPWHPYIDSIMIYLWACLAGVVSIALRMLREYTHKLWHCLLAVRQSDKAPTLWSDLGSSTLRLRSFTHTYKAAYQPLCEIARAHILTYCAWLTLYQPMTANTVMTFVSSP